MKSGETSHHTIGDDTENRLLLLKGAVDTFARRDGTTHTAIPYLSLLRAARPNHLNPGMLRPSFCLVVQGEKEMLIGDALTRYGEGCFVMSAVTLPTSGHIVRTSPDTPYLGLCVNVELVDIASAVLNASTVESGRHRPGPAAYIAPADPELLDVLLRLVRLTEKQQTRLALAPVIMQEMLHRLLHMENGHVLTGMIAGNGSAFAITRAVEYIKANYSQPIVVETLAAMAHMSVSGFHSKFNSMTTVSPIQYQKRLRLLEARRMLLAGDMDASMAALLVGYESATQFSREYKRHFGLPPMQDIARLRHDPLRDPRYLSPIQE